MSDETLIRSLELRLLEAKTRSSPDELDTLLAPQFVEYGSSGKAFDKTDVIAALLEEGDAGGVERSVADLEVRKLAPEVALVTYRASRHASGDLPERHSLRSSVWVLNEGQWQMLFHQGTTVPEG